MLLLRPPVSHTLIHTITKNQIQISLVAAVGHLLIHFQVAGGGGGGGRGCREKNTKWHTGGMVPSAHC